jgi:hypothetical protein
MRFGALDVSRMLVLLKLAKGRAAETSKKNRLVRFSFEKCLGKKQQPTSPSKLSLGLPKALTKTVS